MKRKNKINFAKTDEMSSLVKTLILAYHKELGVFIDNKTLRMRKAELLEAVEEGIKKINLNDVKAARKEEAA